MTAKNLGVVFGPELIHHSNDCEDPMGVTMEDAKIVEKLIDVWDLCGLALGEVQVSGQNCEDYMERYSGFVSWAIRPRFLLTTKNILGHGEQVFQCDLQMPGKRSSRSVCVVARPGETTEEFLDVFAKKRKEANVSGDLTLSYIRFSGEPTHMRSDGNVLDVLGLEGAQVKIIIAPPYNPPSTPTFPASDVSAPPPPTVPSEPPYPSAPFASLSSLPSASSSSFVPEGPPKSKFSVKLMQTLPDGSFVVKVGSMSGKPFSVALKLGASTNPKLLVTEMLKKEKIRDAAAAGQLVPVVIKSKGNGKPKDGDVVWDLVQNTKYSLEVHVF
eukprot:CAMPEP_0201514488 /NCGR_PEP_ID=MMETSP0161_2-20130828/6310_1 /ASSEMBLY_ACC=CAM_ASM_000251 /TAXON_ID=180227 /ORGANISM="Neoparamoeba aestuarina, Strain SoJaBio B1-5/56/2" /LENGTH=327 /DNA_ID=CAMNT_0047911059 /DNA_START=1463 /DNA_END=2446 /DNA_ORIENTATION=+